MAWEPSHSPTGHWEGSLFSYLVAVVEHGGPGLGIGVSHKPLNKTNDAKKKKKKVWQQLQVGEPVRFFFLIEA